MVARRNFTITHRLPSALACKLNHRGKIDPVGANAPVQPNDAATGGSPQGKHFLKNGNRRTHGRDINALLAEPALGVTKIVLHVDHDPGRSGDIYIELIGLALNPYDARNRCLPHQTDAPWFDPPRRLRTAAHLIGTRIRQYSRLKSFHVGIDAAGMPACVAQ
jgi:hypothetical protein